MKKLLKFITCGSVDDGKSTLIGHILYDAKLIYADQEKALQLDSKVGSRGGNIDYSLLLDGLTEEREQGITIDVAYRYFTTSKRSFIVADTPGHEQYTRNMAVGASFADLAVLLLDAEKGVLIQTRRHARICRLMGIRYFVFAVNKMDLVDYRQDVFEKIADDIKELKTELGIEHSVIIPVSATEGDNVTKKGTKIPWYGGPTLLDYLENIDIEENTEGNGFYLPVQRVCRPDHDFRGFQGQIESGRLTVGDEIQVLPGGEKAKVRQIYRTNQAVDSAAAGDPVTVTLDREIDISRGNVLIRDLEIGPINQLTADILWMDSQELKEGNNFFIKIGTAQIPCTVSEILYRTDVNTGEKIKADHLVKNELGACRIRLAERIVADLFDNHRTLGELILIDRVSFMTCACGVIKNTEYSTGREGGSRNIRKTLLSQNAVAVEFVRGGAVNRELLEKAERKLLLAGKIVYLYDASGLTDSGEDIRVIGSVTEHLTDAGVIVLLLISEKQRIRLHGRTSHFLYAAADAGEDEESIVTFIQKISSHDAQVVTNADYI